MATIFLKTVRKKKLIRHTTKGNASTNLSHTQRNKEKAKIW